MPLLLFSVSLYSAWSLKFQNFCLDRRFLVGGALVRMPSSTVQVIGVVARHFVEGVGRLSVEEFDGLPVVVLGVGVTCRPLWRTDADEVDRVVSRGRRPDELAALERRAELRAGLLVGAGRQLEEELVPLDLDARQRDRTAAPIEEHA